MTHYLKPSIQGIIYSPIAISQYPIAFSNFSGNDKSLPSSTNCAVDLASPALAACLEGEVDAVSHRVIILANNAAVETFTIDGTQCEVLFPSPNDECQSADTYLFCDDQNSSLIFDPQNTYFLQIQNPAPDNTIIATSAECPVT